MTNDSTQAVAYLRVSTQDQVDNGAGLDVQLDAIRTRAAALGLTLAATYSDAGISGTASLDHRPGLAAALAAIRHHQADTLIVYRLDRLGRDLMVTETVLGTFWQAGATIITCDPTETAQLTADDPDQPTRTLVRQLLAIIAQFERGQIRMRMKAGQAHARTTRGYAGGTPPYGWQADKTSLTGLTPVESEQALVESMARQRHAGHTLEQIADSLNSGSHRTRNDNPWTRWSVAAAVNHPLNQRADQPVATCSSPSTS